jgi:hypothetical protein
MGTEHETLAERVRAAGKATKSPSLHLYVSPAPGDTNETNICSLMHDPATGHRSHIEFTVSHDRAYEILDELRAAADRALKAWEEPREAGRHEAVPGAKH